jgi:hypothetical protein
LKNDESLECCEFSRLKATFSLGLRDLTLIASPEIRLELNR